MIKIFNKTADYETYSSNGINSGELCYVKEDKSAHFRTNNIDGEDKTYDMSEGGSANLTTLEVTENGTYDTTGTDYDGYSEVTVNVAAPTPQYTTLNLNTLQARSDGKNFTTLITATVGQTIEIYNPNHLNFQVGPGQPYINPVDGERDGYVIYQNGISSTTTIDVTDTIYLEHLYVQNAPNNYEGGYSSDGLCIAYYSAAGTPIDGVIYYRIFD